MRTTALAALGLFTVLCRPGVSVRDGAALAHAPIARDAAVPRAHGSGSGLAWDDAGTRPPPAPPAGTAECATDADCHAPGRHGRCFSASIASQYTQAFHDCSEGATWRAAHAPGTCVYDECRPEDTHGADSCGPARRCGTLDMVPFPQRVCVDAACEDDRGCRRQTGGRCVSFLAGGRCVRGGWACSYPHDACAPRDPERMCPVHGGAIAFCAPRDGRFACVDEASARGP